LQKSDSTIGIDPAIAASGVIGVIGVELQINPDLRPAAFGVTVLVRRPFLIAV
jgi:hypothetical protein